MLTPDPTTAPPQGLLLPGEDLHTLHRSSGATQGRASLRITSRVTQAFTQTFSSFFLRTGEKRPSVCPEAPAALSVCVSLCPLPDKYREYSRGSIPSFKAYGAAWAQSCQNPGADQQGRNLGVFCPKLAMNDRLSSLGVNSTWFENTFLFSFSQRGCACITHPFASVSLS